MIGKLFFFGILVLLCGCRSSTTTGSIQIRGGGDEDKLQGSWTAQSGERHGKPLTPERARKIVMIFKDDLLTFVEGFGDGETTEYSLDDSVTPKAIDISIQQGPDRGRITLGIYSIEGNVLKICWAEPGRQRPTAFTTANGHAMECLTLRRGSDD